MSNDDEIGVNALRLTFIVCGVSGFVILCIFVFAWELDRLDRRIDTIHERIDTLSAR